VGARDLRTLWSPLVSLNQEGHTKAQSSLFFLKKNFPMKTYMVKRAFMCFLFLFCVYFHFDIFVYLKKEANTSGRTEIFCFLFFILFLHFC
jgi:hypothetical protein